jgi:hypothetical protein
LKHSVCILTAYDSTLQPLAAFTVPRMQAFAAAHGYEVRVAYKDRWESNETWIKIEAIRGLLEENFDFIFWLDIDALIVRRDVDVRTAAVDAADLHIVWHGPNTSLMQGEQFEPHYNCGVLLIRVSDWSRDFFKRVWDVGQLAHHWGDQATILHLLGYDNILGLGPERPDEPDRSRVARLDSAWNAVLGVAMAPDPIIHHHAGVSNPATRLRLMEVDATTVGLREAASLELRQAFWWQLSLWRQDATGLITPTLAPHAGTWSGAVIT